MMTCRKLDTEQDKKIYLVIKFFWLGLDPDQHNLESWKSQNWSQEKVIWIDVLHSGFYFRKNKYYVYLISRKKFRLH